MLPDRPGNDLAPGRYLIPADSVLLNGIVHRLGIRRLFCNSRKNCTDASKDQLLARCDSTCDLASGAFTRGHLSSLCCFPSTNLPAFSFASMARFPGRY